MASITYAYAWTYFGGGTTTVITGFRTVGPFVIADQDPPTNLLVTGDVVEVNGSTYGFFEGTAVAQDLGTGIAVQLADSTYVFYTDIGNMPAFYPLTITSGAMPICFLGGTLIATPGGSVAIETLRPGDLVLTSGGEARPLRWLGIQTVSTLFADPLRVLPIRIAAGALGEGLPARDLFVSADHALLIDGLLVQAGALVNGVSIVRHRDVPQTFAYYHVELEEHSLILAEGVPAETFVDNVSRRRFDNACELPDAPPIAEMDLPRVKAARQVPERIKALLLRRATQLEGATAVGAA